MASGMTRAKTVRSSSSAAVASFFQRTSTTCITDGMVTHSSCTKDRYEDWPRGGRVRDRALASAGVCRLRSCPIRWSP